MDTTKTGQNSQMLSNPMSEQDSEDEIDFYPLQTLNKMQFLDLKSDTIRDPKQLMTFLEVVKDSIEKHNKTFIEMSQVTKREARKRPTFTEVRKYLRTKKDPEPDKVKDEIVTDLTKGKAQRMSLIGNITEASQDANFKNKNYDESFLPEVTTETFVANKYATRMWEEMKVDQDLKYQSLREIVEKKVASLKSFEAIAYERFPKVEADCKYACEKALKAKRALHVQILKQQTKYKKQEVWTKFRENAKLEKRKRYRVTHILDILRQYQLRTTYHKWRRINYKMKELGKQDSLEGAQIQLDEFKQKLYFFDKALEKMYHETVSQEQLVTVKKEIDSFNTKNVFNDFRDLFDSSLAKFEFHISKMKEINEERFQEVESKFDQAIKDKVKSDKIERIEAKIGYIQGVMDKITLEQGIINSRFAGAQSQQMLSHEDLERLINYSGETQAMRQKTEQELNNIQDRIISNMLSMEAYEQRQKELQAKLENMQNTIYSLEEKNLFAQNQLKVSQNSPPVEKTRSPKPQQQHHPDDEGTTVLKTSETPELPLQMLKNNDQMPVHIEQQNPLMFLSNPKLNMSNTAATGFTNMAQSPPRTQTPLSVINKKKIRVKYARESGGMSSSLDKPQWLSITAGTGTSSVNRPRSSLLTGAHRVKNKLRQSNYEMYNSNLVSNDPMSNLIKTKQIFIDGRNKNDEIVNMAATFSNYSINQSKKSGGSPIESNYQHIMEKPQMFSTLDPQQIILPDGKKSAMTRNASIVKELNLPQTYLMDFPAPNYPYQTQKLGHKRDRKRYQQPSTKSGNSEQGRKSFMDFQQYRSQDKRAGGDQSKKVSRNGSIMVVSNTIQNK